MRVEISRFAEAHRDVSKKSTFFILLRLTSRNPYFYSVFDTSQSSIVKNALFWKPLKNRDRKKKCIFDIFERIFAGHETPIFIVFGRPPKSGVQLSSLEMTEMGFNYAPVSIYIYLYNFEVSSYTLSLRQKSHMLAFLSGFPLPLTRR